MMDESNLCSDSISLENAENIFNKYAMLKLCKCIKCKRILCVIFNERMKPLFRFNKNLVVFTKPIGMKIRLA